MISRQRLTAVYALSALLGGSLLLTCFQPLAVQAQETTEEPVSYLEPTSKTDDAEPQDQTGDEATVQDENPLPELPDSQLQNPSNSPFQQQSFVPNISLIVDLGAGLRSLSNETFTSLTQPFDLRASQGAPHLLNAQNGFNLNYAELTLQSPIDVYFDLFSAFHFSSFEVEIEEAYLTTRGLPANFQLKAGKFLSHFGRQNAQHAHAWHFNDQPQVYSAFFGSEGLNELGLRASWLAPTDFYLDLGLELLQGDNPLSFGHSEFAIGSTVQEQVNLPSLIIATVKSSVDLSENLVLSGGLSYARGATRFGESGTADTHEQGDMHLHQLSAQANQPLDYYAGVTQVAGADLSLRWFYDTYQELSWQSEFLLRQSSGNQYTETGAQGIGILQTGLYSELLWRFGQQWRSGLRLDLMNFDQRREARQSSGGMTSLARYTAAIDYLPTEFSRLRLQYAFDPSHFHSGQAEPLHELFLTLNLAMGAHGAHEF